jgi:hypothetical protein
MRPFSTWLSTRNAKKCTLAIAPTRLTRLLLFVRMEIEAEREGITKTCESTAHSFLHVPVEHSGRKCQHAPTSKVLDGTDYILLYTNFEIRGINSAPAPQCHLSTTVRTKLQDHRYRG